MFSQPNTPVIKYWKSPLGSIHVTSHLPGSRVMGVPADWVEVDAQGNPLVAAPKFKVGQRVKAIGSGRAGTVLHTDSTTKIVTFRLDPVWQPPGATEWTAYEHELKSIDYQDKSPCCSAEMSHAFGRAVSTCLSCLVEYTDAALMFIAKRHATLPAVKKPPTDAREEALFRKWMGDAATFRGEAKCQYDTPALKAVIDSCPCEPHWPQNEALTEQSRAKVKRHISTNLKAFPVCRHSGQPAALAWDFRQMPDGYGFDGFYVVPRFTCACWSNR